MTRRLWVFLGVFAAGCSGLDVSHDYDPQKNFATLKTWAWAPQPPQADGGEFSPVSSLTHERIRSAVENELTRKGYQEVDPPSAGFWVLKYAAVGQRFEADPGYDYHWYGQEVRVYDEGTIVLDIVDPKEKKLIWRGTARGAVDDDLTPEEREERIQEAVAEILEGFPPKD